MIILILAIIGQTVTISESSAIEIYGALASRSQPSQRAMDELARALPKASHRRVPPDPYGPTPKPRPVPGYEWIWTGPSEPGWGLTGDPPRIGIVFAVPGFWYRIPQPK